MKKIVVDIDLLGNVKVTPSGFEGSSCLQVSDFFKTLGSVDSESDTEEMYSQSEGEREYEGNN